MLLTALNDIPCDRKSSISTWGSPFNGYAFFRDANHTHAGWHIWHSEWGFSLNRCMSFQWFATAMSILSNDSE
jgi:hypothetical protein